MIMDPVQLTELIKVIQQDPDKAAKILAQTGMTPDQLMNLNGPNLGDLAKGVLPGPPQEISQFREGPAVVSPAAPTDTFTPSTPPVTPGATTVDNNQIGPFTTEIFPAAAAQQPGVDLTKLFAGLKGIPSNADTKPIFGTNTPAPRDINGSGKVASAASMEQMLKLLFPGIKGPTVPTIGSLIGR